MIKTIENYSYKVNQQIGSGYSSTVHKGINQKTGQQICIKVIQMCKLQDPINQMLLQHQVSALRSLNSSPNILHLFDVYATKNNTYIITQLCQSDLSTLIKSKKQFPYYQSIQILSQLINGYLEINKQGYLHRDIKPANIFIVKDNVFKYGDFGFAVPINQINKHKNYNVGSPVYMPPEALKENNYSVSSDLWAIGVIFFQLLKGIVPWRAISEQKLYEKIMNQPLSQLTQGLPEVTRVFLSKMLHLEKDKRMTIQELATWPQKLFKVQIRINPNLVGNNANMNMLSPLNIPTNNNNNNKTPLQQITCFNPNNINNNNQQIFSSRQNTHHNNNPHNTLKKYQSNSNNNHSNNFVFNNHNHTNHLILPSPINQQKLFNNIINHTTTNANVNNNSNKINFVNGLGNHVNNVNNKQNQNKERVSIMKIKENIHMNNNVTNTMNNHLTIQNNSFSQCQLLSNNIISYLKLTHNLLTFISSPFPIPLTNLQLSLTKHLLKQLQKVQKIFSTSSHSLLLSQSSQFSLTQNWLNFIQSSSNSSKFIQKINKLSIKYKILHILPKDEFVLQVYKDQLIQVIQRLAEYLYENQYQENNQSNENIQKSQKITQKSQKSSQKSQKITQKSQKAIIALDYLVKFYEMFMIKDKYMNNYKQFITNININSKQNIYDHFTNKDKKSTYLNNMKNKLISLSININKLTNFIHTKSNTAQYNFSTPNLLPNTTSTLNFLEPKSFKVI